MPAKPLSQRPAVMDFDDLADATMPRLDRLKVLKDLTPDLKVTLFTIPERISDANIRHVKAMGDWIALGQHGWRHAFGECLAWTDDEAREKMQRAAARGIDAGVFRAPHWLLDEQCYLAARDLGWVIADHQNYRILDSGCRTYTYNAPLRRAPYQRLHGHLPNVSGNGIEEAFSTFILPPATKFLHITEVASDGVSTPADATTH